MMYFIGWLLGFAIGILVGVRVGSRGVVSRDITEEHVNEMQGRFGSTLYRGVKLWHIQWLIDYVGKEKK